MKFLKGLGLDPFAQPYVDYDGKVKPSQKQKNLARWVNHKAIFKSVMWEDYSPNLYRHTIASNSQEGLTFR